jgi:WD40 repeat protein
MAWSPDGTVLAASNVLWAVRGGKLETVGTFGGGRMTALAWSPDSEAAAGAIVGLPGVWVIRPDGTPLESLVGDADVSSLAWSPDGAVLASGSRDHAIRLYPMTSP